jgi:hypothetical protein
MKMNKLYIFITVLLLSLNVFSQENLWYEKNLSAHKSYFENKYGITYTIPTKLKELDKYYLMWKVRNDPAKHSGYMYGPIFLSKDKECIIAFPAQLTNSTTENHTKNGEKVLSLYPRTEITGEIKTALGLYYSYAHPLNNDTAKFNFYDYVTIVIGKKPREMFNADSIFIYDLPNADSVYFFDESLEKMRKEKYPYCSGMFICKNGRATMNIKIFFTKKGEKKKSQYIEMLNKHIWYDDKFHYD